MRQQIHALNSRLLSDFSIVLEDIERKNLTFGGSVLASRRSGIYPTTNHIAQCSLLLVLCSYCCDMRCRTHPATAQLLSSSLLPISSFNSPRVIGHPLSLHFSFSNRTHSSQLSKATVKNPNSSLSTSKTSHHSFLLKQTPTSLAAR